MSQSRYHRILGERRTAARLPATVWKQRVCQPESRIASREELQVHNCGHRWSGGIGCALLLSLGIVACCLGRLNARQPDMASYDAIARQVLQATDFHGGVIIHVGCGQGELTAALHKQSGGTVQGLDSEPDKVELARQRFRKLGIDNQVTADVLRGERLPYIDNLINLIVVDRSIQIPTDELLRVLRPHGVAYVNKDGRWSKQVKPLSEETDDWTHYMHDASNNAVAHDTKIGPPRQMQWVDGPTYGRHHDRMSSVSAVVTANGRVFEINDLASPLSILLPPKWTLTARDAYNGTLLWKRPLRRWFTHLWPLKSGPAILPRRLVAEGDRVYVTLGIDTPLVALDAATGQTVQTYPETKTAEEVIYCHGTLLLVVNHNPKATYDRAADINRGYKAKFWDEKPRQLMAFDALSGSRLWAKEQTVLPGTLAANQQNAVFHDGQSIVALELKSGRQVWRSEPVPRAKEIQMFYLPILVLYQDVILFSGGETAGNQTGTWYTSGKDTMTALSLKTGKKLWSAYHPPSGYRSPEDLLVVNGLVWTGETTSGRAAGEFTGRDPHTGEVKVRFKPDVTTYWFHHRCYRGKATDKYLLMARAGTEFVDVRKQHWNINHWIRGACLYGVMPANGLLYAPQHPCACYLESKLSGFNAVGPATAVPRVPESEEHAKRLEKGPAYSVPVGDAHIVSGASPSDWPTLRHDAMRSGKAGTQVTGSLNKLWQTHLGAKLSSPVMAGGRVFVASLEDNTVHAVDAKSGKPLWSFSTTARVDSPPTVYQGRVYFGAADGWVYALQASDGALAWRFLAAPMDQRLVSYQRIESVWPVHGSLLIQDGVLYCVAGRSMFLDSGLRLWRLDPKTGAVLSKTILDNNDPVNGKSLQQYVSWLNMPPALPDVLSSDGKLVYMRSQPFRLDGTRLPLSAMPHGADADRGAPPATQNPKLAHLFSPTGLLDDSWWHRTYWMFGSRFVSGWSGYYLSGRVAPAGRILVLDRDRVFGFGRKPKYFRWTTPIEYQLFCAEKFSPTVDISRYKGPVESRIRVPKKPSLNPKNSPITVAAWCKSDRPGGVAVAHGGGAMGYALYLQSGTPRFSVRCRGKLTTAAAEKPVIGQWVHLAGVLTADADVQLYVDGKLVATTKAPGLLNNDPQEGIEIGADEASNVGDYVDRLPWGGVIDEVRIYHRALTGQQIAAHAAKTTPGIVDTDALVLAYSFDHAKANDLSDASNHGTVEGATSAAGKIGKGFQFTGQSTNQSNYTVTQDWTEDLPMLVRAMVLTDKALYVAGPPDVVDEEAGFRAIGTVKVQKQLQRQLGAIDGKQGALLWAVSPADGRRLTEVHLQSPPVFDGLIAAGGRLFVSTIDGNVVCFGAGK